ncbi:MAG: Spermidine/putrescine transporter permease PotB [Thermodesulfobacteriota bacterium]|uniref:spermidine/putrescine ABC transporter permease PotB n=1 Tax=Desulfobacter sp. TaxID=2294 RepID=UPI00257EFE70|nr:spermidine/putrescine ABC transporter permease PotB [Desulfobacter sp.]MDQ1269169.1 Spermidine/putrescine transporter permease PotB [Thermodesulfobacteriota bacterium]
MKITSKTRFSIIVLISGWFILFGVIPLLLLVITSFLTMDPANLVRFSFSLKAYSQLLIDPSYMIIFIRSVKLALTTTLLCLALGYPFAWYTARMTPKWRTSVLVLLMIPFWTNSLVRTYAMRMVLGTQGILNKALVSLGLIHTPLKIMYTDYAVVAGLFYLMLPFMVLPLYATIEKLDFQLVDAARDLGAGAVNAFTKVIFPLTLPGIMAGCIMVFVPTMGLFYVASLLGGARQLLVGNLIQQQFLNARNWPMGSATSIVLIIFMTVMLIGYGLLLRRFSRGRE